MTDSTRTVARLEEAEVRELRKAAIRTLATFDESSFAANEARRASYGVLALADEVLAQRDVVAAARKDGRVVRTRTGVDNREVARVEFSAEEWAALSGVAAPETEETL